MNGHAKAFVEKGIRWVGLPAALRTAYRHHVMVLAYHNIVPDGESIIGDRSLHLERRQFARQLDWIRRTYDVVPLTAIFDDQQTRGRPRAVITFDDAYRGAVVAGVQELVDRDMPATIFVAPAFVGGRPFWWDVLAAERGSALSAEVRQYAVDVLDGRNDRVLAWARENNVMIRRVPSHQTVATEEELASCARLGKITLGSHTWSHPNLSRVLTTSDLEAELRIPLEWLQSRFECAIPWLTYPYGIASNDAAGAARRVGYHGALLVSGGLAKRTELNRRRYMMPRLNVPSGLSLDGLALRSTGMLS